MTRPHPSAIAAWLLASLGLAACSALGLGEHDLMPCDPDGDSSECAALNAELPAGQCARYYCHKGGEGGCVLEERVDEEACDGLDNDCDHYIDEDAPLRDAEDVEDVEDVPDGIVELSHATASSNGALHIVITSDPPADDMGTFEMSHLAVLDEHGVDEAELLPEASCLAGEGATESCRIDDLAIAATSEALVGAGFHRSTCGGGQLRVGIGSPSGSDLQLGEATRGAGTALRVDVRPEQGCTVSAGCQGAFGPAVAMIPASASAGTEAFVVWQATSADDPGDCDASEDFRIAALALPIEGSGTSARFSSAAETSMKLSERNASGPPAIVSSGVDAGAGYVVAFPSGDRIELVFVPRVARAASMDAALITGSVDAERPKNVSLAAGAQLEQGLAVAYESDLAGGSAVQLIKLRLVRGDEPRFERVEPPVTLAIVGAGQIIAAPSVSYASVGFVAPGSGKALGGWVVTWIERASSDGSFVDRVMARRVAEADLHMLGEPVELAHGAVTQAFTYSKQVSATRASLHSGFVDSESLHLRKLTCD